MNVRKIRNDTFFFNVYVVWPVTPEEFRDYVRGSFQSDFEHPGDFRAICVENTDDVVIGFKKWDFSDYDLGNLCHETAHATYAMLQTRGMKLSDKTEEVYAYLHNSLFENCLKAMRLPE